MNSYQVDAFWSKVDIKDNAKDCWNWHAAKKPTGYGNVRIDKKYMLAHRVAFELANGVIPPAFIVCHICDNPSCCNPGHLMLGTIKSNSVDMLIKNRQKKHSISTRGSKNLNSKLTESDIPKIRLLHGKGKSQKEIAQIYGVSAPAVRSVLNGKTWRHV
ncbi:MAG: HNH endonuclease [Candidatus Reddybacter sp.]